MSTLNVNTVRNSGGVGTSDTNQLGQGQTYQNLTAQRVAGTDYTNSTGRPIWVCAYNAGGAGQTSLSLIVDGLTICIGGVDSSNSNNGNSTQGIIPAGSVYRITGGFQTWVELR